MNVNRKPARRQVIIVRSARIVDRFNKFRGLLSTCSGLVGGQALDARPFAKLYIWAGNSGQLSQALACSRPNDLAHLQQVRRFLPSNA